MLQLTRVYKGNSMFRGNASLNGQLSHVLEGNNVTQVLPLESPDAWARRQDEVITYLRNFRQLVMLFNKERPTDCEWRPWDGVGAPGNGSLFRAARPRGGSAGTDGRRDGDRTMCKTSLWAKGAFVWSRAFLTRSTPWERADAQPVAARQEKGWGLQPVGW